MGDGVQVGAGEMQYCNDMEVLFCGLGAWDEMDGWCYDGGW